MRSFRRVARCTSVLLVLVYGFAGAMPGASARSGDVEPKIVGGGPASPGEYPFIAAILNEGISGDDYQKQFCGGSLIADTWVLTAAHCVEGAGATSLAVAVGRVLLNSSEGQRVPVAEVIVHPSFHTPTSLSHDAALLRLASSVTGIAPIQLAGAAHDGYEADGTVLTVIGWGTTTARGRPNYPNQLQEADVQAVSDARCAGAYGASLDAGTMVCAAAPGTDSCYGDSGGPLFADDAGTPVQVGVVSWGNGCAKKRFPGVYSEVNNTAIRSWVTEHAGV